MEFRTDRAGVLIDQLTTSSEITRERLQGLTAEEYLWEPAPGMWSLRPRDAVTTERAYGVTDWVLEFVVGEPEPPPLTTIAWRLNHLLSMLELRWEWSFGPRRRLEEDLAFSPSPDEALAQLWASVDRWVGSIRAASEEQLSQIGFSQYPRGLDPDLPFIAIMWWVNREFIHHSAEVALLRDLYRHRVGR